MRPPTDPPSPRRGSARRISLFVLATVVLAAAWLPGAASLDWDALPLEVPTAVAAEGDRPEAADGYRRGRVVRWPQPAAVLAAAALVVVPTRGRVIPITLVEAPPASGWPRAWVNRGPPRLSV